MAPPWGLSTFFVFAEVFIASSTLHFGSAKTLTPYPTLITSPHTEIEKISQISMFRSGFGHDYSTLPDICCSMKHYFEFGNYDWAAVRMFAPADAIVVSWDQEQLPNGGYQLQMSSTIAPEIHINIFHLAGNSSSFSVGQKLFSGQYLSTHIGPITDSDIAVRNMTDNTLLSYFDVMTDSVFTKYQQRGVRSREDMIITFSERQQFPLSPCPNGSFNSTAPHGFPDYFILSS